ncbi:MAG: Sua5/YciO/YrdC/YwlC family protein [Sulfuricellaceae bacterium]
MLSMVGKAGFLDRLRAHFRRGGLIAYPTESCYGLGCDPRNARAVRRLLRLKGRPQGKGLILIAERFSRLQPYLAPLSAQQRQRLFSTWPGPHTWLTPAARNTPRWLRGKFPNLAVRVSAHPGAAALCHALGSALISTSANRAGLKPLKTCAACRKAFGSQVLVVPGRIGRRKKPSIIQDLVSGSVVRVG